MHERVVQPIGWLQYLIPIVIAGIVLAFRIRRMSQERPLKLEQLWIVPAMYLVLVVAALVAAPPKPVGWLLCLAALAVGASIGWQRGKAMRISVDPATHRLNHRASPLAMLILVALIVIRAVLKAEGSALHLDAVLLTDILLALALGLFAATRAEMYLRGRRLLDAYTTGSPAV